MRTGTNKTNTTYVQRSCCFIYKIMIMELNGGPFYWSVWPFAAFMNNLALFNCAN